MRRLPRFDDRHGTESWPVRTQAPLRSCRCTAQAAGRGDRGVRMQVLSTGKRKIAVVLAVLALSSAVAGCLPDNQGNIGPSDRTQNEIFQELNIRRRNNGLPEFGFSPKLGLDAQIWAAVMSQ